VTARSRRLTAAATAAALGAIDLVQKATAGDTMRHDRSAGALVLMAVVLAALLYLVPLFPSLAVALGAGVAAGGALGNLVSMLVWGGAVPDPIVVRGWIAFNLADVFVLCGDALLLASAAVYALRHRGALHLRV
jgi:lipoprotein signal peptidase